MKKVIMHFDGSCTRNNGDGDLGLGVHAEYEGEEQGSLFKLSESGGVGTNNEAEYLALILGLKELVKRGLTGHVEVIGDSQLTVKQMNKEYAVRDYFLQQLYVVANAYIQRFDSITFTHTKRDGNSLADELAKDGVKRTIDYYNYKF